MENTITGFAIPLPHNVCSSPPHQLPPALLIAEFVFVCEDASVPSLALLYFGPHLVLERQNKYFRVQLGSRTDILSVDRLKPAFSENPISAALPPVRGWPALHTALRIPDPPPSLPSAAVPPQNSVRKGVCFVLFWHLFLLGGTLSGPFVTEVMSPLFLPCSFLGDFCGGQTVPSFDAPT